MREKTKLSDFGKRFHGYVFRGGPIKGPENSAIDSTSLVVANQRDNAVALESEFTNLLKHKKLLLLKPPNAKRCKYF